MRIPVAVYRAMHGVAEVSYETETCEFVCTCERGICEHIEAVVARRGDDGTVALIPDSADLRPEELEKLLIDGEEGVREYILARLPVEELDEGR